MENRKRPAYISNSIIKVTAILQALLGSGLLVLSGVILFSLPSFLFWACFFAGLYLFVPGVVISFSLVSKKSAQTWAKVMIPLWRWFS